VIPVKYRPYFDNKVQTKKSLGTANLRTAILGASEMLIRHELKMKVINQGKLTTDPLPTTL
jgi:hypothetical protein